MWVDRAAIRRTREAYEERFLGNLFFMERRADSSPHRLLNGLVLKEAQEINAEPKRSYGENHPNDHLAESGPALEDAPKGDCDNWKRDEQRDEIAKKLSGRRPDNGGFGSRRCAFPIWLRLAPCDLRHG